jgi:hypothetical protein
LTNTITGSDPLGVVLSSPVVVASSGKVSNIGQLAAVTDGRGAGTLTNYGLITSPTSAVYLAEGGTVDNHAGGIITGFTALNILHNAEIDNAGVIEGFGLGIGFNGGNITNELGGVIEGGITGVTGLITNAGTIERALGNIIDLSEGGFVINSGTAAQLTGGNVLGVLITGGGGNVSNQGAIDGISLQAGGVVSNQGYIGLGTALYAVGISGGNPGSVDNKGRIVGVELFNGGNITNESSGIISGNYTGIKLGVSGTVNNTGTILGVGGLAGELAPGKLGGASVFLASGTGTITNASHALILGTKYGLELSGTQPGDMVVNYGLIAGRVGIRDIGPTNNTIVDYGTITGTAGVAVQFGAGSDLLIMKPGAVLNGKVAGGTGRGTVEFNEGTSGNSISWLNTAFVNNVTFINETPTLNLSGANQLVPGEILSNAGLLISNAGLDIFGTLTNTSTLGGTITLGGTFSNPYIDTSPAQLLNKAGAVISSSFATAIHAAAGTQGATIENAGTIADTALGGVAISFTAGPHDLLIVDPGSKIIGRVDGGNGAGTMLQLGSGAATGSIASFASQYMNFATVSVAAGAAWEISGATVANFINNGTVMLDPTTMTVNGPLTGTGVIEVDTGSLLIINAPVAAGETIAFTGTGGTLALSDPLAFSGTVLGFVGSQTIDLTSMAYNANGLVLYGAGNALEIIEDNTFAVIHIAAAQTLAHEYFHLSSDGLHGTDIIESSVPCFLRGTLIRTAAGEIAVEDLRIGDVILDAAGAGTAVKWIGRRRYAAPLPENPDIIPVQIKAGALADDVPVRDLFLSPLHAVGVDGFLVPAGALINGVSVIDRADITEIEYFHIETGQHDMIIANGAPAETFIDHESRKMFDNADEYAQLYPHGQTLSHVLCAPRLEFGPELESIRRKIALRAGVLPAQPENSEVIGFLEHADRRTITGWAYAPARPNLPLGLEIFNRGALLARTIANIPRPDVKIAGFGNGRCGFSITLPAPLPALQRHEISVRPAGATQCLPGSPAVLDPGIAHDLLKTGGLQTLIEAAVKGLGSADEVAVLGNSLEAAGKQIKLQVSAPRAAAQNGGGKGNVVLVLDEAWPTPTLDAGSNAVISHMESFLRLGREVVFCATAGAPRGAAAFAGMAQLQALGVACHGQDGATAEECIRALAGRGTQAVYLHRLATAAAYGGLARQYAPRAKVIFSVADLHHLRLARQAEVTGRPDLAAQARAVKATEIWAMQLADCVVTHSRAEADYLRREIPGVNVEIVPWAVPVTAPLSARRNREHIAFIGGAGHAPNLDAVTHLARDIMPLVWQRAPAMKCFVAGDGWPVNLFEKFDPRMVSLGHQPDLAPLLAAVRLTVAPLRFGAGIKGKVLVSLAAGTPCAMSDVAAEGLPLDANLQALTGDGAVLADNILALYTDKKLNRVAAQSGLDMIQTSFTHSEVDGALARVLGIAQPGRLADSSKATAALQPV